MRALSVSLAVAMLAQGPVRPPGVAADVVRIDLIATDAKGHDVDTLTAADFVLREDGTPQTLDQVQLIRVPPPADAAALPVIRTAADERQEAGRSGSRLFSIFLDDYHVSAANAPRVRDALNQFIDRDIGPLDLVTVMRPLESLLAIRLTRDRDVLHRAINAFEGRKGDYEPRTAFERNYMANQPDRADAQRAQATWSALSALTLHLANLTGGRKTILLASEEAQPLSRRRGLESLPTSSSVMRVANRANVSIYVLDPREASARQTAAAEGTPDLLSVLADDTDGAVIAGEPDFSAGLARMVADASTYYLLTYRSAHDGDGLFHSVEVTVKKPGVRVRARKGYWAPTIDEIERATLIAHANDPKPVVPPPPPRRISGLIRPWFGVSRGTNGKTRVTFVWEPSNRVPGDRNMRTPSRIELHALGPDGSAVFDGTVLPAGYSVELVDASARAVFDVPPGRLRLRMSIEDAASQPIDTDVRDLIVRDLRGVIVIGTPEVLRARTARDVRALERDPGAVPVVSREFSRTEELIIRVAAYGSSDTPPIIAARLLNRSNQVMRQLTVQPAGINERSQIDLPLAGLAPGEYSVEITAADGAAQTKENLPFRVTS